MHDAVVPPLPASELARWAAPLTLLVLMLYLVSFDQSALSQSGAVLHELLHDGRHLLGVPCH